MVVLRHPTLVLRVSVRHWHHLLALTRTMCCKTDKTMTCILAVQAISMLRKSTTIGCCETLRLVTVDSRFCQGRARCAITCRGHPLRRSSSRLCNICCQRQEISFSTTEVMVYSVGVVRKSEDRCSRALTMLNTQQTIVGRM